MIEAEYVEGLLAAVRDPGKAASLKNRLRRFGSDSPVWPFYNAAAMREALSNAGVNPDDYMREMGEEESVDLVIDTDIAIIGAGGAGMTAVRLCQRQDDQ